VRVFHNIQVVDRVDVDTVCRVVDLLEEFKTQTRVRVKVGLLRQVLQELADPLPEFFDWLPWRTDRKTGKTKIRNKHLKQLNNALRYANLLNGDKKGSTFDKKKLMELMIDIGVGLGGKTGHEVAKNLTQDEITYTLYSIKLKELAGAVLNMRAYHDTKFHKFIDRELDKVRGLISKTKRKITPVVSMKQQIIALSRMGLEQC